MRRGGSMKRTFLMLAHKYVPNKYSVFGWFMSEKLDGQRFLWDGGVTRGMFADEVPWANTDKKSHLLERPISSGLWSRYGNVIHAPAWWLDNLPPILLDGELYSGRGQVQTLAKIIRVHEPNPIAWQNVKAAIFDSPPIDRVFEDGEIKEIHYTKTFKQIIPWFNERAGDSLITIPVENYISFNRMTKFLTELLYGNSVAYYLPQEQLEFSTPLAIARIEERLKEIVENEGEGIVLRKHTSVWTAGRTHDVLKYKPYDDAEATVIGYVWGRETDKGSKLLGLMGTLVVQFGTVRFELSGFKDIERVMTPIGQCSALEEGKKNAGEPINSAQFFNEHFPIGSRVTFRYRELTDDGVPKEARYHRKEIVI